MKRLLFDENMPAKLRRDLPEFFIRTAQEQGWAGIRNGELLQRAFDQFDVLITLDQQMRFQQNLPELRIALVVIALLDARLEFVRRLLPRLRVAIASAKRGDVIVVR